MIEVGISEFDFQDVGQMAGHMGVVDDTLNTTGDDECIGLLVCQSEDNIFAQYALFNKKASLSVAEYYLYWLSLVIHEIQQAFKTCVVQMGTLSEQACPTEQSVLLLKQVYQSMFHAGRIESHL